MTTQISQPIHFKGFVIEEETDPWAIKYGMNYRYYREGSNGERIYSAASIKDAKEEINDRVTETE